LLTPIVQENFYCAKIEENVCKKALDFITPHQQKFEEQTWNCKIRTSNTLTHNILNLPDLHELKMHALSHVSNYMYQTKLFLDGYIRESWINIYEKDFYQEFHTHTGPIYKYISAVIYLTDDNSEIEFNLEKRTKIKPEFSQILIFPEHIPHRVIQNKNDKLRISLAFNFACCEVWDIINL